VKKEENMKEKGGNTKDKEKIISSSEVGEGMWF
jgi:hypothetical protein